MPDESSPLQTCTACSSEVDVSDFEPLTSVECPVCGTLMVVSKQVGPYELVEVMGRGGMGVVYRAIDRQLDRQVALKVLREDYSIDDEFIRKLEEEAAITGGINHPNVVKVFTTGTAHGRFYLAMELVDKGSLDDLMEVQGRIAEAQALEIASQAAQGLRAASALGLIHRDVKPGNILFADSHSAKIVDFGLAMLQEAAVGSDEIWGTPYYVSPERLDKKREDFRSDIYSLGATIFHAIAGRPPFEAEDAGRVALKHLKSQAVSLQAFAPWVSGSTAFVINRMLNKDPLARYDSYDELVEQLEYARSQLGAKGRKPADRKRFQLETDEDRKRMGLLTVGIFVFVLLAGGAGGYYLLTAGKKGGQVAQSVEAGRGGERFEAAHKLLMEKKPGPAAEAFHALAEDKKGSHPLQQWCLVEESLAHLLNGNLPKAQAAMKTLEQAPYQATEPNGRAQASFFAKLAPMISDNSPCKPKVLEEFNPPSYGVLALIIGGLKNWELGDDEGANSALRSYQFAKPTGEFIWTGEYAALLDDYISDLSVYRAAVAQAKAAQTPADLRRAAAALQKVKGELKRGAKFLAPKLDKAAKDARTLADERQRKPPAPPAPKAPAAKVVH